MERINKLKKTASILAALALTLAAGAASAAHSTTTGRTADKFARMGSSGAKSYVIEGVKVNEPRHVTKTPRPVGYTGTSFSAQFTIHGPGSSEALEHIKRAVGVEFTTAHQSLLRPDHFTVHVRGAFFSENKEQDLKDAKERTSHIENVIRSAQGTAR
jgi:hypothetical protein